MNLTQTGIWRNPQNSVREDDAVKRNFGFVLILLLCSSCSTGMTRVCKIVDNAVEHSYREVCNQPAMIRVRENTCDCDPELKFEAMIYGQWRHVSIVGNNDALAMMAREVEENGAYCFYMTKELYVSENGQQFYQLMACEEIEFKTLLSR